MAAREFGPKPPRRADATRLLRAVVIFNRGANRDGMAATFVGETFTVQPAAAGFQVDYPVQ